MGPLGAGRKEGTLLVGAGVVPASFLPLGSLSHRSPTLEAGLSEPGWLLQAHPRTRVRTLFEFFWCGSGCSLCQVPTKRTSFGNL